MKSLGEKLYDACASMNVADLRRWADMPARDQAHFDRIATAFISRLSCSETEQQTRDAFDRLSKAANTILAHVTAKVGRALYEAPDEDLVPLMADYGVELPAKLFRILYEAADPALLAPSDDHLSASPSGSGYQRGGRGAEPPCSSGSTGDEMNPSLRDEKWKT